MKAGGREYYILCTVTPSFYSKWVHIFTEGSIFNLGSRFKELSSQRFQITRQNFRRHTQLWIWSKNENLVAL